MSRHIYLTHDSFLFLSYPIQAFRSYYYHRWWVQWGKPVAYRFHVGFGIRIVDIVVRWDSIDQIGYWVQRDTGNVLAIVEGKVRFQNEVSGKRRWWGIELNGIGMGRRTRRRLIVWRISQRGRMIFSWWILLTGRNVEIVVVGSLADRHFIDVCGRMYGEWQRGIFIWNGIDIGI